MAEDERILSLSEKDGTDTSQSKDTYVPEESTLDISISLSDIQMPETPESTKGQTSDGDTSRLESPKTVKPVLGKVQAKKRLMAFANQFKVLSKSQIKPPNLSQHSTGVLKTKDKTMQDDTNISKSKKKTEEKILAIEEIRREESKSKMLLAEAMAAASMEDENHTDKNTSGLFKSTRHTKEKSKHERTNDDHKSRSMDRKYSERHRQRDKTDKDNSNQDLKDRNESSAQKSSQDKEKHKKDKKKKDDKDKRGNSKTNANRDKKEDGKDKKEKQVETRERNEGLKNKKENVKEKRNDMLEMEVEGKDKKEKDKDKWKEKMLKYNSWAEVRKSGLTLDDIIHFRRRDNSERSVKIRTMQDYTRYLEQMLMLSNHRLKRQALIAEGLDGPKKYPPESIKLTKRARGLQLLYCENPRSSLLLNISQLLQAVTPERRERIRDICEASLPRIDTEDIMQQKRNWYQQINAIKYKDTKWQMTVQLPKSKWDSEDEEMLSISVAKEEVKEKPVNKLSVNQQERCSTSCSETDEDKIDNNAEDIKEDNESSEKTIENMTMKNDEVSTSSLLQSAGNEKLASEYEQFIKMVCSPTGVTEEYSPKKNSVKSASPHSYHEFNIESNLAEDNTNIEIPLKENFEKKDKLQAVEGSIKSIECEESTLSTDCQIQINNNMQIEHTNENDESEDSKSIPSDWENVRIKVERLSDENTESREVKKKKKQKKITSSSDSSSSSSTSSDSEKEKKKKKRKRKVLSNSSSSDSDSTDSSSSSSDSSSSEERRKKKRKKKKIGKKRKKARRAARTKKKRRRQMSTDSNSSDSDEHTKKKKRAKKKTIEAKSINNGDISKIISKSPVIVSPSDEAKVLHSATPVKKIKEEAAAAAASEDKKKADLSTKKASSDISVHDKECLKQKRERKESKPDENFMEQWEMDSMMAVQQNDDDDTSSQDRTRDLEKIDGLEKGTYRRKRKHSRDNIEQDKSSTANEERLDEGKARSDEEIEAKRKKRREKDIRNSTEFLANWEREGERITQQMIQSEAKYSKKLEKQKKEKWGETDFDTLNVPSLTQLEKEVGQKQLLADEWEVDSLEAISDLIVNKRKSSQGSLKKIEKEVRYDKETDTYIAIEKESVKEMKKRQERLCAIRIWEEEQEEGEREEMMLLEQKSKRKRDDWDIEEESFLRKNTEKIEVCKVNNIVGIEKEWAKTDEEKNTKGNTNKLTMKSASKRVKKSRWDMGSQSEEKSEAKDIWEEEYTEWSQINKCEQELEKTKKGEFCTADYSENSVKSNLIDFYHRKSQSIESLERSWASEEVAIKPAVQAKKDASAKHLVSVKTNEEQLASIKKEHETRDQFKEIFESDVKFKEKTVELYSPSSPALSQKSQDIEVSNESNYSNSLLREKRKKEMLITADELSIPMSGIPLQLTKLRDTKHASSKKIEDILNEVQLEDKGSAHDFDIKKADSLFDDLSMNESCPKIHTSEHMDIFAEYGSEMSNSKQYAASSSVTHTKDDEANEGKNALKLIPKQLLVRRTNEQIKPKRVLEAPLQDPAQHAAALLTIQKKLLESHALKNDIKELPNEQQADQFKSKYSVTSETDTLLDTEFPVVSKSIAIQESKSLEKPVSIRSEQSENYNRESKNDNVKRYKTSRNLGDTNVSSDVRSPVREQRKKSPSKKEKENEKRYSHDKDKKERKSDDTEKPDRRDVRSSKADFADRRRPSPSGRGRRRRSGSPYVTWERQGSGSKSPGRSWSRSRSRSPKRKDEATSSTRDRDRKRERYEDERSGKSRTDERKERYARSPPRSAYNEDNFKKYTVSSKNNRDDWGRRHDNIDRDREKDIRSYDPMEILRERTMESEKYRDKRLHTEELDRTFWQYDSSILRDGNESMDSYTVGQDLPLEYHDRPYYREGSPERDMIQSSPQSSKYRRRSNAKRERQWEKDKDSSDLDRHGHLGHRLRNRTPPRSRYSPMRQAPERFRRKSRSHSRSWSPLRSRTRSRSGSRSRSTSRSRPRMRSQSRSRSRSSSDTRLRGKSASMSRLRSPEHGFRMSELRSSRSPSPGRDRLNEIGRERKDEDENGKFNICGERGRRIETIVQSGVTSGTSILDSGMGINSNMDAAIANFQYSNELEGGNEYYYTENNLTYPPCIDESSTSSPKRLSLDDRLELELGIKKQHSKDSTGAEYSSNFNSNVIAYSSPPQQQQQMMYRQQPTVVQVGNVLQVVPADFNGVQLARREVPAAITTPPVRPGSSQVVRVGNVLQVVPTSLDWSSSGNGQSSTDQSSGVLYSPAVPAPSPSTPSVPMSVPVPVPVPLPVPPALSAATNTLAPVAAMSPAAPLSLSLPVPVPVPVPVSVPVPVPVPVPIPPATAAALLPRNETQPQKIAQPVYNYEAILETRRKEREERKRSRELRRKEKERRRIERVNRRALRLLEKSNTSRQTSEVLLDHRKGSIVDPSVLKALKEGEETESPSANPIKEEDEATTSKEEDEDAAADEEEDDDEDEIEAEAEDDEEEEEEAEDEDEDDDDDEKPLQMINQRTEVDEATTTYAEANKDQTEIETKEWLELPPPPKGILVVPGFRRDAIPNGNLDDSSDADDDIKDGSDKDEEIDKNNECDKDTGPDGKSGKSSLSKLKKTQRNKKSVQFADGVKPGEGTSPSGGEGDMPSPPPPKGIGFREGLRDLRRDKIYSSRKSRKQEKRARPPKAKKKVKVKIIKLKKPRITPLTAMMMDDSDEMDDRSPPPPPPGSPPPPHLWPSYLSIYNTTVRAVEQPQNTTTTLTPVQAPPPPPTPLPLLIPPPPLNYTIQPCSKS